MNEQLLSVLDFFFQVLGLLIIDSTVVSSDNTSVIPLPRAKEVQIPEYFSFVQVVVFSVERGEEGHSQTLICPGQV